jgi:hypothetical protein
MRSFDVDLRSSSFLGMPSIQPVHDYYPFALEDMGRLAPIAVNLVDRLAIMVAVIRFPSGGLSLFTVSKICPHGGVYTAVFRRFLGDVRREFM